MKNLNKTMKTNEKETIKNDMNDVIASSRRIREFFEDDTIDFEEKVKRIKMMNTMLSANKSIVCASIVKINVEKIGK